MIVHPHAQRTGGGTIRNRILAGGFGQDRVYSRMFVKNFKHWPKLTDEDLRGYLAYTDHADYCELPLGRKCLPIVSLRHPVYRAISLYHFVRRKETHEFHRLATRESLEDFYRTGSRINPRYFRNVQVSCICAHADARLALEYIRTKYLAVGFTSHLDDFAQALSGIFGWSGIQVERKTADAVRYDAQITPKFRDMVLGQNEEDSILFEAMIRGEPYYIPRTSISRAINRRAKRARDRSLALARGARRRIGRLLLLPT
ncbi:MAG TPA: hypothetical protein VHU18_05200 [Rhizomicrobium sp.]|nr:hypothetical protein [Rhizomicrobium sp.]